MKTTIIPNLLSGNVKVPPSKSLAHRAIICASLANGQSTIHNIQYSQDILATIDAMRAIGASIKTFDDYLIIKGNGGRVGEQGKLSHDTINARESGSTLRFIIPILSLFFESVTFVGEGKLGVRPQEPYIAIFEEQQLSYQTPDDAFLPLTLSGAFKAGTYHLPGNISSQFISGLMFTLPLLAEDSEIVITTDIESVGYLDLTLDVLKSFGIEISHDNYRHFTVKGNQSYLPTDYTVEGDFSQAAFFLCAQALGNPLVIQGLNMQSAQGDRAILEILEGMGCEILDTPEGVKLSVLDGLKGSHIDGSQCPDILPVVAMTACYADGQTVIYNSERLKMKESDRISATVEEVQKIGGAIQGTDDGFIIEGNSTFTESDQLSAHNDHRIAMLLAIASTKCAGPVTIDESESVRKSYPNFWEEFTRLGGNIK